MEVCKISDVIRDARIRSGMTQEALAFGICSVSTLSKIENGRRMPQVRVFEALYGGVIGALSCVCRRA